MWISTEDARSDFILGAAALVFGTMVAEFVFRLPFYPSGSLAIWLLPVWVVLLMVLPPRFLGRNRGQELEAFGLGTDRAGLSNGILLVVPLVVAGYVRGLSGGDVLSAALGRLRGFSSGPSIAQTNLVNLTLGVLVLGAAAVGSVLLFGLLTTRARDAFRATEMPLLEALRTYAIGAVAVGTVLGLLIALADSSTPLWTVLLDSGSMVIVILVADRMVDTKDRTTRATILAPAITALIAFVFALGGGLFGPNLAVSLYRGAMSAALAVVLAVLLETRRGAWAIVPLVAVTVWAPTCATLPVAPFISLGC